MRTIHYYIYVILLMLLVGGTSCDKGEEYTADPVANFEALWWIMDENYCFFSYKQVDWDEVYDRYRVQVTDTMDQYALFDLMA